MLCEKCNENEATVHYTEIANGVKTEHHLCNECAKELDLSYYSNVLNSEFPFAKLLTGLLASSGLLEHESDSPMSRVVCPKCGMNYQEFTRVGKFGCAECYNVFGPLIEEHLKKLHGNTENVGKKYRQQMIDDRKNDTTEDGLKEIETLTAKLKEAIELENFEDAAKFRDYIKAIKEGKKADA